MHGAPPLNPRGFAAFHPPRSDVDVQYHYELKPFETEKSLIRQAEARLRKMLDTAPWRCLPGH